MTQIIDQAPADPEASEGQTIELKWNVNFNLKFFVPHPLNKDEFIKCANEHLEWMRTDLNEKFPKDLLVVLDQYQLVCRETFKGR